jgi:acetyltransferase-like isoleucine patch superfamily enzyme
MNPGTAHLRRFGAALVYVVANHVIARVPSFVLRHFFYRRVLGYRIGRESAIHMGVSVTGPSVSLGDNVVINRGCHLDGRVGIAIADNVGISPGVRIYSLEHDPDDPAFATRGGVVTIEKNAWIGAHAMILPGVTIGEGAVIGAGAIVTRAVAPYRVAVGVPAREIRDRPREIAYKLRYYTWFDTDVEI